jgi:hypothetical protein
VEKIKLSKTVFWITHLVGFTGACGVLAVVMLGASAPVAEADTLTAGLASPPPPATGSPTVIDLSGVTAPSQASLGGTGYSITFSSTVDAEDGIVRGDLPGVHLTPVAGLDGGARDYLTGGYGSALTTNLAGSGNYFSTGLGIITITFANPQSALTLLWGSDDAQNSLSLNDSANFTATGSDVAAAFFSAGYQTAPPGNSGYVVITTSTPFTSVTATSTVAPFEFAGVAASTTPFATRMPESVVPEPATTSLVLFGTVLAAIGCRRRFRIVGSPTV